MVQHGPTNVVNRRCTLTPFPLPSQGRFRAAVARIQDESGTSENWAAFGTGVIGFPPPIYASLSL